MERLFKINGGFALPNFIVPKLIPNKGVKLCEDGIHYERIIGDEEDTYKKMIFGIPSKEIYNEVVDSIKEYTRYTDKIKEAKIRTGF